MLDFYLIAILYLQEKLQHPDGLRIKLDQLLKARYVLTPETDIKLEPDAVVLKEVPEEVTRPGPQVGKGTIDVKEEVKGSKHKNIPFKYSG